MKFLRKCWFSSSWRLRWTNEGQIYQIKLYRNLLMSKTLGQTDRRVTYFSILHLCYESTWNSGDSQRAGRSRNRILGRKFFLTLQTGPGVLPASCKNVSGSFPGAKWSRWSADHLFPSGAKVCNGYELYHLFISMSAEAWNGETFTFTYLECMTIVGAFLFLPKQGLRNSLHEISSFYSYSSSIVATAQCGLWSVEQCPIWHQLSPSFQAQHLKISFCFFSPSFPGPYPSFRPFHFLSEDHFVNPILLHSLQVTQPAYPLPLYPFYYIFSFIHLF